MAEETLWYYANEGEQAGPVTPEQLQELAATGAITPATTLWAEGLEEWVPATMVEGLFPEFAPEPAPPSAPVAAEAITPVSSVDPEAPAVEAYEPTPPAEYPVEAVKRASFGKLLGLLLGGPVTIGALTLIGAAIGAGAEGANGEVDTTRALLSLAIIVVGYGAGSIMSLLGAICGMVYLHRAWTILRWSMPRTTPGKAVGLLFVPFYSLYWIFVAYRGLAEDWNRTMATYPDLTLAPRMNDGLFLAFCICVVTIVGAPFAPILWFIMMANICQGINFMAGRASMRARPGGLQFY